MAKNIYEKIWDAHVVHEAPGQDTVLFIDRHFVHEVTSPQAFEGLRLAGRAVRHPELTFATMDHNIPTTERGKPIADLLSKTQVETLLNNCREFGVTCFDMGSEFNGIVHVIGPELGLTQPGCTIVCGDSHTATHGAFGALAFGIGTSEVEHVRDFHADPAAAEIPHDGSAGQRHTGPGRDPQGRDSRDHREDWHGGGHGLCD